MTLLPEVISIAYEESNAVTLSLLVQPELHYFPNHFPNYPLLPGVVQLDWVIHFGRGILQVTGEFCRMDNIKFQAIVRPAQRLNLRLQWQADTRRLAFTYTLDETTFSSGIVVFTTAS